MRCVVGLARAVGAEQPDDLAGADGDVDAAHRLDRAAARLERAGEPACLDHGASLNLGSHLS